MSKRIEEEKATVTRMIGIYCHAKHATHDGLCDACEDLRAYAMLRLERCPFGDDKVVCGDCPIHCYKSEMREAIRVVMRYAGPRMLWADPASAVKHLLYRLRKPSAAVQRVIDRKQSTETDRSG